MSRHARLAGYFRDDAFARRGPRAASCPQLAILRAQQAAPPGRRCWPHEDRESILNAAYKEEAVGK